jgi:polyhydroxyalkanoate synthase subunit PhaE
MSEDPFQKFYKSWIDSTKSYVAPWLSASSETEEKASTDFMRQSNSFFERMLWFPPFSVIQGTAGPATQYYAKYSEIASSSIALYQKWLNIYLDFSRAMTEAITKFNTRFIAGSSVDAKQSYALWLEEATEAMDKLLKDPEVASKLASFLSSLMDLKSQSDAFMETYYKMMNIPTRTEMDRAYKEIYDLKKIVRRLRKELDGSDSS